MDTIIRTTEVRDEREAGKSLKADARGVLARLAQISSVTVDDLGTDSFKLREDDDRDAMISAVRDEAAKIAQITIMERPEAEGGPTEVHEESTKAQETDPRLTALQRQYEALSEADRIHDGKILSWQEVLSAIQDMPDFLAGVESLEQAQVYFLNEEGQLVLGDGCAEPLEETLGWGYNKSRTEATRIFYIDSEGKVVVVDDDDTEIPSDEAQVISQRGLITIDEYQRINKGQFERTQYIWPENGKNNPPTFQFKADNRGSRCVLRVNLNFGS